MNRRGFFARSNPLWRDSREGATAPQLKASNRNELFMLAMAQGIDPATVAPERLPELLGLQVGEMKTQGNTPQGEGSESGALSRDKKNELFMLAMAQGIDPATVDPERLPELLGLKAGEMAR